MRKSREVTTVRRAQIIALDEAGNTVSANSFHLHIFRSIIVDIFMIQ